MHDTALPSTASTVSNASNNVTSHAAEAPAEAATILIVEDEAVVALDLKMELQSLGYRVVGIADTAAGAVEQARRLRPALTLMDIMLRDDDDARAAGGPAHAANEHGIAAALQLRDEDGPLPVIFLTSFSDAETVQRAARASAYGYLTKPFQPRELRAAIEMALWKSRSEQADAARRAGRAAAAGSAPASAADAAQQRGRGEFLSRVSHEMRTPLNAVLGFAELLQQRHAGDVPAVGAYSGHILDAGRHLLALVDDVLDLQRAGDGTLRLQMAATALDDELPAAVQLLEPLAEAREIRLVQSIPPGRFAHVDAMRLRQVLLNVGSNAIKYNVRGGSVVFRVAPAAAAGRVRIVVEDSGIGMTADQLDHLFEPFNRLGRESLQVPGTGLGLVITRELVEQMGGTLDVSSTPGSGTIVQLEFDGAARPQ